MKMKTTLTPRRAASRARQPSSPVIGKPVDQAARAEADRQRTEEMIVLCRTVERRLTVAFVVMGVAMFVVMAARMVLAAWGQG